MRNVVKKIGLICLLLMLGLSLAACGEQEDRESAKISEEERTSKKDKNKNTDEDEDEEEEEKKPSKEEKETEEEPTPEPATGPSDEQMEYDKEAMQILREVWTMLMEALQYEDMEIIEDAKLKLEEINTRKCSKEVRRLLEEDELLIKDLELILEWSEIVVDFAQGLGQIEYGDVDITKLSSLEDIETVYGIVENAIEECEELETPQFMEHTVNRIVVLLVKYQTLLAELYKAIQNQDVLTAMSAYCFYNDWQTEQEDLFADAAKVMDECQSHTNVYTERFKNMGKELAANIEAIEAGDYEGLDFSYLDEIEKTKVTSSISCIDTIYPALYNRMQAVAIVNLSYVNGVKNVLVTVEVEGFSQKYEKTIEINQFPQRYYIKPPVISSGLNLDSQKNTQIKVTITDVETGNMIASETENVKIMSINDFILSNNEYGYTNYADVLAWVTPESYYIQELLRIAADNMEEYTGCNGIFGYQPLLDESEAMITAYQVYAIQKAISDVGVRYVRSSYSIGEATNQTQRVNRPDETLLSKSGICIETSVLMASALQAAGMNSMIVLTTGHCQVAVETWEGSGEYLLIETTLIPLEEPWDSYGSTNYWNVLLEYKDIDEWADYIDQNNGMVYSCDLATYMDIIPLNY